MKGYLLDENGDVVIRNGDIVMCGGDDLTAQTCRTTIGTNKGEWFLNEDEGINFRNVLAKNPNFDLIRDEILSGLLQVDSTFTMQSFEYDLDWKTRKLIIDFKAQNSEGREVSISKTY